MSRQCSIDSVIDLFQSMQPEAAMARKHLKTNSQTLTLTLEGDEITAEKFVKGVSAFVSIIRDVTESLSGEKIVSSGV